MPGYSLNERNNRITLCTLFFHWAISVDNPRVITLQLLNVTNIVQRKTVKEDQVKASITVNRSIIEC